MEMANSAGSKPAKLLRRMTRSITKSVESISADGTASARRITVEAVTGSVTISLEGVGLGSSMVWTQNGVAIPGQDTPMLHLANLSADDSDIYFAVIRTAEGQTRSQAFILIVSEGQRFMNVSARGWVEPGREMIVGFVVVGGAESHSCKKYLLRALGPTLKRQGVITPIPAVTIQLFRKGISRDDLICASTSDEIARRASRIGAYAVRPSPEEPAIIAELTPGLYSLTVKAIGDGQGETLVEVYELSA
jgi:hypothetical protein